MKKLFALTFVVAFIVGVAVSPIWAGGGKNHGDVGTGTVDQGATGETVGEAQSDDAQGNQAD